MATLIPEMDIEDFRKLNTEELKRLKSCEVFSEEMPTDENICPDCNFEAKSAFGLRTHMRLRSHSGLKAYLFTFVNGNTEATGYLRTQTEFDCQAGNAVGGLSIEEILSKEVEVATV